MRSQSCASSVFAPPQWLVLTQRGTKKPWMTSHNHHRAHTVPVTNTKSINSRSYMYRGRFLSHCETLSTLKVASKSLNESHQCYYFNCVCGYQMLAPDIHAPHTSHISIFRFLFPNAQCPSLGSHGGWSPDFIVVTWEEMGFLIKINVKHPGL